MGQTIGALLCCSLIAVVALWGRSRILVGERSRSFARTAPARQPSVILDRHQLASLDRELANRTAQAGPRPLRRKPSVR